MVAALEALRNTMNQCLGGLREEVSDGNDVLSGHNVCTTKDAGLNLCRHGLGNIIRPLRKNGSGSSCPK